MNATTMNAATESSTPLVSKRTRHPEAPPLRVQGDHRHAGHPDDRRVAPAASGPTPGATPPSASPPSCKPTPGLAQVISTGKLRGLGARRGDGAVGQRPRLPRRTDRPVWTCGSRTSRAPPPGAPEHQPQPTEKETRAMIIATAPALRARPRRRAGLRHPHDARRRGARAAHHRGADRRSQGPRGGHPDAPARPHGGDGAQVGRSGWRGAR